MPPRKKSEPEGRPTPTIEQAAQRRRDAMEGVKPKDRPMVEALLAERRGYEQRGLTDRVRLVDEQLRLRGYQG